MVKEAGEGAKEDSCQHGELECIGEVKIESKYQGDLHPQSGCQAVDPIDQVEGVDDDNENKDGYGNPCYQWNLIDPQETVQVGKDHTSCYH